MNKCKICNATVTDAILKRTYYDPEYPSIDIGPYCANCIGKVRICSGCHMPHQLDVSIKYFQNGNFFCKTCEDKLSTCGKCRNRSVTHRVVKGVKLCESCFSSEYSLCSCCEEVVNNNGMTNDILTRAQYPGMFKKWHKICNKCFSKNVNRFKKREVAKCYKCNEIFTDNGTKYCDKCTKSIIPCSVCGGLDHTARSVKTDTTIKSAREGYDAVLCSNCKGTKVKECSTCSRYTLDPTQVHGRFFKRSVCNICKDSSKSCGECKVCLKVSALVDKDMCSKCTRTYGPSNICSSCGTLRDPDGVCRVCNNSHIYNYSTKPPLHFWYGKKDLRDPNVIFMGIENEITFSEPSTRDISLKKLYKKYSPSTLLCKSDGSIEGYGYEIVTQPMTLESFHAMDMTGMFNDAQKPSSSCGMHVHVGRNAFTSDVHLMKIVKFIDNNKDFTIVVAGRGANNYCSNIKNKPSQTIKDSKIGRTGRGCQVNLTNPHTVEFRLFAGCTKEFEIRYRLEYTHALVSWSKYASLQHTDPKYFIQFVSKSKKEYPNLWKFLQNKFPAITDILK